MIDITTPYHIIVRRYAFKSFSLFAIRYHIDWKIIREIKDMFDRYHQSHHFSFRINYPEYVGQVIGACFCFCVLRNRNFILSIEDIIDDANIHFEKREFYRTIRRIDEHLGITHKPWEFSQLRNHAAILFNLSNDELKEYDRITAIVTKHIPNIGHQLMHPAIASIIYEIKNKGDSNYYFNQIEEILHTNQSTIRKYRQMMRNAVYQCS